MAEKKDPQIDGVELRRIAEERLGESPETEPRTVGEARRLLHELEVYKIELEMQNAELSKARNDMETVLEKYTDLYDFAPVGYFTLDRKGTIRSVNLTGASLLGIERSRLNGRRFEQFVANATRPTFAVSLRKVFTSLAKETCEVALLIKGNSQIFVQIEAVAAASGQECRVALIDITKRMQADEALRTAKEATKALQKLNEATEEALRKEKEATEEALRKEKEATEALRMVKEVSEALRKEKEATEAAARTKRQFLANMSHELRTPMTVILAFLQLTLEEDIAPVPRGYLETTLSSARSLLRILNDILDMAKIEAGKLTIDEKPFSLQRCITEAVDIITPELRRKGLDFAISIAEEMPDKVVGDQGRLRQVLINLIGNAVKFTERGKVAVRLTAGRATSNGQREFTFAVTDTGIGIPEDKNELLFRTFSQVDASHTRRHGGTGLGLAISREIVELMGGTISFESAEGVGSTFSFTIPLTESGLESDALSAADPQSTETTSPPPEGEWIPHLLLAEDDPTIRQVLGLILKRSNYRLDLADDGLMAVEMWEKGEYDLVLMDIQMPRLNGFEATRAIREKERERGGHTPIVAMTAHALKEDEQRCLAAGMDAYISKPIDFEKTRQVIEEIFKQKPSGVR